MSRRFRLCVALLLGLAAAGGPPRASEAPRTPAPDRLRSVLGGDAEGFARAMAPRRFEFPADHGAHPEYRSEWWYFTGNLDTAEGRRFGFQLTFFRFALSAEPPAGESAWADRQVWMAHFAVTDAAGGRFQYAERLARAGPGLAGAEPPFQVWLEDWTAAATGEQALPMRLRAATGETALDLLLEPGKPIVLQGEQGLSRKSDEPGNASYYYSMTRLPARGSVTVEGERHAVSGSAWLDREWSTSALADDQAGWDWFALQLADGRDLMVYRLRRTDGGTDPSSAGVLVAADGRATPLAAGDFSLEVLEHWQAPDGRARYPARVRLRVPAGGMDLEVRPLLADQELRLRFRYWEGAVEALEADGGEPRGRGYLEMTGYADAP